jgi:hypothetical protein
VATLDAMQQAKAQIFKEINDHLQRGSFGNWRAPASSLHKDEASGRFVRAALPGKQDDQPVNLSERDAEAYAKAQKSGPDALRQLTVEDQALRFRAGRRAMGIMREVETHAGFGKYQSLGAMMSGYAELMAGFSGEKARSPDNGNESDAETPLRGWSRDDFAELRRGMAELETKGAEAFGVPVDPDDESSHIAYEQLDKVERILKDPEFAKLPPPEWKARMEEVLAEGAKNFSGKWTKQSWEKWGQITSLAREGVAGMETPDEMRQHYFAVGGDTGNKEEYGQWFSGIVPNAVRELTRSGIAAAFDLSPVEPDHTKPFWRVPGTNIANGVKTWSGKAGDSARVFWSKHLTQGQKGFAEELSRLKNAIDAGEFPMNDPTKLGEWLEQHASGLSKQQAAYYEDAMGEEPWNRAYAVTNGLLHPQNAALLADYMQTRDPEVWDQLASQLARTPRRAEIEAQEQERLQNDSVVKALDTMTGRDYSDAMKMAGDPINLASMLMPAFRALKAGEAVAQSSKLGAAMQAGRGVAEAVTLGNIGLAIEDPNATWAQHVQTSKDMVALSLGMAGAGVGMMKLKTALPELLPREEAKGASLKSGAPTAEQDNANPFNAPRTALMMDATGLIAFSRVIATTVRRARDFASWSAHAVERFGPWAEPHVKALWDVAKEGAPAVAKYLQDTLPEKERQAIQLPNKVGNPRPKQNETLFPQETTTKKEVTERLPKNGSFSGTPGNSQFYFDAIKEKKLADAYPKGVPFVSGRPDLEGFRPSNFSIRGVSLETKYEIELTGKTGVDNNQVRKHICDRLKTGLHVNSAEAELLMRAALKGFRLHHHLNTSSVIVVPKLLHTKLSHYGERAAAAARLRKR